MSKPRLLSCSLVTVSLALAALSFAGAGRAEAQGTAGAKAGDRALGEYLGGECVTCHQASGRVDGIPSIVGWPADVFAAALRDYRSKTRPNPVMQIPAERLTDDDILALAAYFGSLPAPAR